MQLAHPYKLIFQIVGAILIVNKGLFFVPQVPIIFWNLKKILFKKNYMKYKDVCNCTFIDIAKGKSAS